MILQGEQVSISSLEERIASMLGAREAGNLTCFYLHTGDETPYARFIEVTDVLHKIKLEAFETAAQQKYGKPYGELEKEQKERVLEQVGIEIRLEDSE